jgi:type I restriction enzyme R subunit
MTTSTKRLRELRQESTTAETAAWWLLRNRQVRGLKFRRQCPLGGFVVDFYCSEARLVIEVDGSVHAQPSQMRKDREEDRWLRVMGMKVLRVPNGLVLENPEAFRRKVGKPRKSVRRRCEIHDGWRGAAPSPGPLRLVRTPAAVHPLPPGERVVWCGG